MIEAPNMPWAELHDLEQRALRSAAKATSLIRKLVANSPHASLEALEQQIAELRVVRTELAVKIAYGT